MKLLESGELNSPESDPYYAITHAVIDRNIPLPNRVKNTYNTKNPIVLQLTALHVDENMLVNKDRYNSFRNSLRRLQAKTGKKFEIVPVNKHEYRIWRVK